MAFNNFFSCEGVVHQKLLFLSPNRVNLVWSLADGIYLFSNPLGLFAFSSSWNRMVKQVILLINCVCQVFILNFHRPVIYICVLWSFDAYWFMMSLRLVRSKESLSFWSIHRAQIVVAGERLRLMCVDRRLIDVISLDTGRVAVSIITDTLISGTLASFLS